MSPRRATSRLARAAAAAAAARRRSLRCISSSSTACLASTTTSTSPFETALAVATCGNGDHGRLGHGDCSSLSRFTLVTGGGLGGMISPSLSSTTRPIAVAAGGAHTLVLTADGAVLSFGLNDAGQLGHSEGAGFVTVPVREEGFLCFLFWGRVKREGEKKTQSLFFLFRFVSFSLTLSKNLNKKQTKKQMEALVPEEVVAVAAGDRHSLAVGASGRVWAWGAGGGAGAAPGDDSVSPPARLPRLVPGVTSAAAVAAGSAHSLILCRDHSSNSFSSSSSSSSNDSNNNNGVVYSWGDGSRGALGHAEGAASATGSGFFSFFFSSSSSSRRKNRGRAAAERAAPRLLRSLAGLDVLAISASGSRSGAVVAAAKEGGGGSGSGLRGSGLGSGLSGGRVLVWGDDGGFRAAVSGAGRAALDCPAPVPGLDESSSFSVSLLALGRSHALAARVGGTPLLAWGDGSDHGALGLSSSSSSSSPHPSSASSARPPPPPPTAVDRPCRVEALDGKVVKSVSAGWKHSLACSEVSAEAAFGGSHRSSSSSSSSSPSPPPPSLFSWGWGGSQGSEGPLDPTGTSTGGGQLGTGDDLDRPRPFAVSELVLLLDEGGGNNGGGNEREEEKEGGKETASSSSSSPRRRLFLSRWRALQVSAGLNHSAALVEVALD